MAVAELHNVSPQIVGLADSIEAGVGTVADRRLHRRLRASELGWLRGARLKYGAEVRVIDISAGGALIETDVEIAPSANIIVELTGPESSILIPSRVLRCQPASLKEILKYHGACVFKKPITLPELATSAAPIADPRTDRTVRAGAQAGPGWQKVIARYLDGRMLCGYTNDFHPSKTHLHLSLNPRQGDPTFVPIGQLKALFFVREFEGNPTIVESTGFVDAPRGRKVEVTFHDGEVLVGSTLGYRGEGNGFFVQPADLRSNNLRVFVTAAGARKVRLF